MNLAPLKKTPKDYVVNISDVIGTEKRIFNLIEDPFYTAFLLKKYKNTRLLLRCFMCMKIDQTGVHLFGFCELYNIWVKLVFDTNFLFFHQGVPVSKRGKHTLRPCS